MTDEQLNKVLRVLFVVGIILLLAFGGKMMFAQVGTGAPTPAPPELLCGAGPEHPCDGWGNLHATKGHVIFDINGHYLCSPKGFVCAKPSKADIARHNLRSGMCTGLDSGGYINISCGKGIPLPMFKGHVMQSGDVLSVVQVEEQDIWSEVHIKGWTSDDDLADKIARWIEAQHAEWVAHLVDNWKPDFGVSTGPTEEWVPANPFTAPDPPIPTGCDVCGYTATPTTDCVLTNDAGIIHPTGQCIIILNDDVAQTMASVEGSMVLALPDDEYAYLQGIRKAVVDEEKRLAVKYGANLYDFEYVSCASATGGGWTSTHGSLRCSTSHTPDHYEFHGRFLLIEKSPLK